MHLWLVGKHGNDTKNYARPRTKSSTNEGGKKGNLNADASLWPRSCFSLLVQCMGMDGQMLRCDNTNEVEC